MTGNTPIVAEPQPEHDPSKIDPATAKKRKKNARWQLLALVSVFVLPWIAAFLYTPAGRINNGELIEPAISLPEIQMKDTEQRSIAFSSLQRQWLLLTTADEQCSVDCEKTLYTMRQVRLSLGKHAPRVRSVLVTRQPLPADVTTRYQEADSDLVILSAETPEAQAAGVFFEAHKEQATGADGILLIDPNGNLMMRYEAGFEPKLIRKDLSRLLKASRIG